MEIIEICHRRRSRQTRMAPGTAEKPRRYHRTSKKSRFTRQRTRWPIRTPWTIPARTAYCGSCGAFRRFGPRPRFGTVAVSKSFSFERNVGRARLFGFCAPPLLLSVLGGAIKVPLHTSGPGRNEEVNSKRGLEPHAEITVPVVWTVRVQWEREATTDPMRHRSLKPLAPHLVWPFRHDDECEGVVGFNLVED